MSKIPADALIADFQRMEREHWSYGAETREGNVDCSGAFVWAYEQHGHYIYHGSNRMARTEVVQLIPISEATIVPGMAAFKVRSPGENYYALPSSYKAGGKNYNGDLGDYYHVGLVDVDTSKVLNARSSADGFVSSPITQNWDYVAYLTQVDYGEEMPPMSETRTAVVVADSGNTVNLRSKPNGALLDRVPVGATVTILAQQNGWCRVDYSGMVGWMDEDYLLMSDAPEIESDMVSLVLPREVAEQLLDSLSDQLGWG